MLKYPIETFYKKGYRCTDFDDICNDFNVSAKEAARICYLLAEFSELKRIEAELCHV